METATSAAAPPWRVVFADTLGKRYQCAGPSGEPLEAFELRAELGATEGFESALRERVDALAGFQNACFPRVRGVERRGPDNKLVILTERLSGTRLSAILAVARQRRLTLDAKVALCVIRQLLPAVAMLHEKRPPIGHGAIAPDRIVITHDARVAVTDHMLGSALATLAYSHERYWKELRLPLPHSKQPAFDQRADIMQIGIATLTLVLGRTIDVQEWPEGVAAQAAQVSESMAGAAEGLQSDLHVWLRRMLQIDDAPFASAMDAWTDLERVLDAADNVASFDALGGFMTEYMESAARSLSVPGTSATTPAPSAIGPEHASAPAAPTETPSVSSAEPVTPSVPASKPELPVTSSAPGVKAAADAAPTPGDPAPPAKAEGAVVHETAPQSRPRTVAPRTPLPSPQRWRWAAAAAILIAASGVLYGWLSLGVVPAAVAEAPGVLVVTTQPAGVPVLIDGTPRGVTPLTLELTGGVHELRLVGADAEPRVIPLNIVAGTTVSQNFELSNKAAAKTGELHVRSDPSGARVTLDEAPIGTTPLTLDGITPGTHRITVTADAGTASQEVVIEAGKSAALFVPLSPAQGVPVSGWIAVSAPAELHLYEGGRLLGTSRSERIMVSVGRHELEFVNEALSYRTTQTVTVAPGKVSSIAVEWPKGSLALNAQPWADVWVDGQNVGETPIGSVILPIGIHEVVFRHPQLGEQRVRATVTAGAPVRVSVDMSKR
jgi:hypothetical protein